MSIGSFHPQSLSLFMTPSSVNKQSWLPDDCMAFSCTSTLPFLPRLLFFTPHVLISLLSASVRLLRNDETGVENKAGRPHSVKCEVSDVFSELCRSSLWKLTHSVWAGVLSVLSLLRLWAGCSHSSLLSDFYLTFLSNSQLLLLSAVSITSDLNSTDSLTHRRGADLMISLRLFSISTDSAVWCSLLLPTGGVQLQPVLSSTHSQRWQT